MVLVNIECLYSNCHFEHAVKQTLW